jgi:hypothetical protein
MPICAALAEPPADEPARTEQKKIEEAIDLFQARQFDKAREKLRDEKSVRANFLYGLICVFGCRDLKPAERSFEKCVDHVGALNNRALVELRLKKNNEAVAALNSAMQKLPRTGKFPKEISQNICRLAALSANGTCRLSPRSRNALLELHGSLPVQARGAYDARVGWLYMPFRSDGENHWIIPEKFLFISREGTAKHTIGEDRLCMYCDGRSTVKCTNPQCKLGRVISGTKMNVIGVDRSTGVPYGSIVPVYSACAVCGGRGKILCPNCWGGIELDLLTKQEEVAYRSQNTPRRNEQEAQQASPGDPDAEQQQSPQRPR